jgi:hypothetical protein
MNIIYEKLLYQELIENKELQELAGFLERGMPVLYHPRTINYYNGHVKEFERKKNAALNKEFLVKTELERFKRYTNDDTLKELYEGCYIARGFKWAMSGEIYTVDDFLYFRDETRPHLYDYVDYYLNESREYLRNLHINIDNAALGHSYALYVNFLKNITLDENNSNTETTQPQNEISGKGGLTARAKVLLLHQLGFFKMPQIENLTAETLAPVISAIIGNGLNIDNIGNYISARHGLESAMSTGKPKKELEKIKDLLATIQAK